MPPRKDGPWGEHPRKDEERKYPFWIVLLGIVGFGCMFWWLASGAFVLLINFFSGGHNNG